MLTWTYSIVIEI